MIDTTNDLAHSLHRRIATGLEKNKNSKVALDPLGT